VLYRVGLLGIPTKGEGAFRLWVPCWFVSCCGPGDCVCVAIPVAIREVA
jgi:hypothetical protein